MKLKPLGTVLPTRKSLLAGDRHYAAQMGLNAEFAAEHLAKCDRKVVGGEVRYYEGNKYAVVSSQKAKWFEVRADGDYPIKAVS